LIERFIEIVNWYLRIILVELLVKSNT